MRAMGALTEPMRDLSLHVLDIAENSVEAGAARVLIELKEDLTRGRLTLIIVDNGRGMDMSLKETDPYYTGKPKRYGMGIPLLRQAARECGGDLLIESAPGAGTRIRAEFGLDHIDLKPLGDMAATMTTLIAGHPEVDFALRYSWRGGERYDLDLAELRPGLGGMPMNAPPVLELIRKDIKDGLGRRLAR